MGQHFSCCMVKKTVVSESKDEKPQELPKNISVENQDTVTTLDILKKHQPISQPTPEERRRSSIKELTIDLHNIKLFNLLQEEGKQIE